jgi:hypothetical protein
MELSYTHLCRYLETNVANLSLAIWGVTKGSIGENAGK